MKTIWISILLSGLFVLTAREMNVAAGLPQWQYCGSGQMQVEKDLIRLIGGGEIEHWVDLDYVEHSSPENTVTADRFFRLAVAARGQGQIQLGVTAYQMTGKFSFREETRWSKPFNLSDQWHEHPFEQQENNPATIFHNRLSIRYLGQTTAELKAVSFIYPDRNDFLIRFEPAAITAIPGDTVRLTVITDRPNQSLNIRIYDGHTRIAHGFTSQVQTAGNDGKIGLTVPVPAQCRNGLRITASAHQTGVKANCFITLVPPAVQQELQQRRQQLARLPYRHILFLGDSLSDYDRGRNYIDLVAASLPPGVTVRNAGVGGDFTSRLWQRLQGKNAYRQEMYDHLFEPKPDLIFLFLGANDAKASSRHQYRIPMTPPQQQAELYRKIVHFLRQKTGAKIVFLNTNLSYWPEQLEMSARKQNAGIVHNRFGEEKHIVNFNRVLKEIAEENRLDVIDLYTPTQNHPDPRRLYLPDDGVHLTLAGHSLIAREVLKYLSTAK